MNLTNNERSETLFPVDLPEREWLEFNAKGFQTPVSGVIHRGSNRPVCGMPLGGVETGCLDIEADGSLGYATIFNTIVPRRGPLRTPFIGVKIGQRVWLLTTLDFRGRPGETPIEGITYNAPVRPFERRTDAGNAREIHYWGHYPVVDMEFVTDSPLSVGLRAWSPFLPGQVRESDTPGAVFEVHLRNCSNTEQTGAVALSFPGPLESEAGTTVFDRREVLGRFQGITVESANASFALGLIGPEEVRTGGDLGTDLGAWAHITRALPQAIKGAGSSAAADYRLRPGETRVVRFVLAWYSPNWKGGGVPSSELGNIYTHMYASWFRNVRQVAEYLASNCERILGRIIAWQSAIYAETSLPVWLRDSLVNNFHLITEDGLWAQAKPPIGEWCRADDGVFGMIESPGWCPQIECMPCSFYGNLPLVYFFPELALSTLRAYKAYQYPDGQVPWIFGGTTCGTPYTEMAMPSRGYESRPQATLDGACYVSMVDRMLQRTGDPALLDEFYESVKENTVFTMNLRPGSGAAAVVSMPKDNLGQDWFENCALLGIVPHIGGIHLAQLRIAKRMAEAKGDLDFARQCQEWIDSGSTIMEDNAWAGDNYLLYNEVETGSQSDVIMGYQLDGEWIARFHGLPGVFRPDRVATTLATLKERALSEDGAITFTWRGDHDPAQEGFEPGYWGKSGVHPPSSLMLAMIYIYAGQHETGFELARCTWTPMMEKGWHWDLTSLFDAQSRERRGGFDYYQNMMLWALPVVVTGRDLTTAFTSEDLISRIIKASKGG